jgi:hypothetical protein
MTTIIKISKCICQDVWIPQSISSHVLITFSEWKQHSSLNDLSQASLVQFFLLLFIFSPSVIQWNLWWIDTHVEAVFWWGLKFVRMSQRHDIANIWGFIAVVVINLTRKSNLKKGMRFDGKLLYGKLLLGKIKI